MPSARERPRDGVNGSDLMALGRHDLEALAREGLKLVPLRNAELGVERHVQERRCLDVRGRIDERAERFDAVGRRHDFAGQGDGGQIADVTVALVDRMRMRPARMPAELEQALLK